ncbi:hypothetical protein SCANM63S_02595 [Streptomyces canarius]
MVADSARKPAVMVADSPRKPAVMVVGCVREPFTFGRRPRAVHHPPQGRGGHVEAALEDGPHARPVVAQGQGRYDGAGRLAREAGTGEREGAPAPGRLRPAIRAARVSRAVRAGPRAVPNRALRRQRVQARRQVARRPGGVRSGQGCLGGPLRVMRSEQLRGEQQGLPGVVDRAVPPQHRSAQQLGTRAYRRRRRAIAGRVEQPQGPVGLPGQQRLFGGGRVPPDLPSAVRGEVGGAGEGRAAQCGRHRRIRLGRGGGEVGRQRRSRARDGPRAVQQRREAAPVGQCTGQRVVGGTAPLGRRVGVHGAAQQPAAETDPAVASMEQLGQRGDVR